MTLIVENGTGLANAEAYGSVAGYRAYWTARGVDTAATNDAGVEALLRAGTDYIDTIQRYKGVRASASQALEFPRSGLNDWNGFAVTGLPAKVTRACYELARKAGTESLYVDLDRGGRITGRSVAGISVSYEPGAPVGKTFRAAMKLLEEYARSPMDMQAVTHDGAYEEPAEGGFAVGMHEGGDPS